MVQGAAPEGGAGRVCRGGTRRLAWSAALGRPGPARRRPGGETASDAWRAAGRDQGGASGGDGRLTACPGSPRSGSTRASCATRPRRPSGAAARRSGPSAEGRGRTGGARSEGARRPRRTKPDASPDEAHDDGGDQAGGRRQPGGPLRGPPEGGDRGLPPRALRGCPPHPAPARRAGAGASPVRELYGLTLYRLGRWAQAQRELEAFRAQTGAPSSTRCSPTATGRSGATTEVEELWDELRAASPSAELVAEGRIVAAGALADQGRLDDAIAAAGGGGQADRAPEAAPPAHRLRPGRPLRAGRRVPRARELFGRVAASDPDFVDVQARLRALR